MTLNKLFILMILNVIAIPCYAENIPFPRNISQAMDHDEFKNQFYSKIEKSWEEKRFSDLSEDDKTFLFEYCYQFLLQFPWTKFWPEINTPASEIMWGEMEDATRIMLILSKGYILNHPVATDYDQYLSTRRENHPEKNLYSGWKKSIEEQLWQDAKNKTNLQLKQPLEHQKQYLENILLNKLYLKEKEALTFLVVISQSKDINQLMSDDSEYYLRILEIIKKQFSELPHEFPNKVTYQRTFLNLYYNLASEPTAIEWFKYIKDNEDISSADKNYIEQKIRMFQISDN